MNLTKFTETGEALTQLNIQGYVDTETARHLIAEGLAEPQRIRVEMRNFPCKDFEGIALTLEGSLAANKLDQQAAPLPGLSDTRHSIMGPELADSQRAVTIGYLRWLGEDGLSQLDRQFAWGWCPDMPNEPTEVIDLPLPLLRTSRRKTARKPADKIGPVDSEFDQKAFMDELWGED
ncbi:hypothetical protein [Oceaniglobus trochenteri]|uniref:hypothetical protein n=1 Tax=Oceaniglobus trochenteri TaxID=2763260 RepID=UPI001CFF72B3|nr:hypothetical protein [Oceaniglobus trochenteri]